MKKIKLLSGFFFGIFIGTGFISCSDDTINDIPVTFLDPSLIYNDSAKVALFVNNIYSGLPSGYNRLGNNSMLASSTDEAVHSLRSSEAEWWGTGTWTPYTIYDDAYASNYASIRKTFVFEEDVYPNIIDAVMSSFGRNQYLGQVFFLRAFFNFELLKRYGGYPIVDRKLSTDDDLNIPRSNYDDCVNYITGLCDQAADILPLTYPDNQLGRITRGTARALKAKVLLYAASPLFNDPNKPEATPENGYYDPNRWKDAAKAAAAVINLKGSDGKSIYELYNSYERFFYTLSGNKEIILSRMSTQNNTIEQLNAPVSITGGQGGTCPTADLVDDYEMKSGVPFDWNNPAHATSPFTNRDPRFDASILYNGSVWMNNMTVETFDGGKDLQGASATRTSFYLRKFLDINARFSGTTGVTNHCFPLIRYGEVLLNYAEAMNEAYGPDADPSGYGMTARAAVKLIRQRAGLTGNIDLSSTVPAGNKEKMREAVHHERRIELSFEEHRHLDLRRWKEAETVLNRPVSGLKIVKNADQSYTYSKMEVERRVFYPKFYLYPFYQIEISRNNKLIQNTGW